MASIAETIGTFDCDVTGVNGRPFTCVGNYIDNVFLTLTRTVSENMITGLGPLFVTGVVLYIIIKGYYLWW